MTDLREIMVVIPGNPKPCPRPRSTKRGIVYMPSVYKQWQSHAQAYIVEERNRMFGYSGNLNTSVPWFPPGEPVLLQVLAVFPCPKGDYRKALHVGRRKHVKKTADADNILKAVMDACTPLLWLDDAQVSTASCSKWVGAQGEAPYIQIVAMRDEVSDG
jgi:Holliday junction resolvase RusA-like endonuclease